MDTVTPEVVSATATKINFDKRFLVGVAVGATIVAGVTLTAKLKKKINERRALETEENETTV